MSITYPIFTQIVCLTLSAGTDQLKTLSVVDVDVGFTAEIRHSGYANWPIGVAPYKRSFSGPIATKRSGRCKAGRATTVPAML